jgi:undecaprenyl-diphosphatase
LPASSYTVPMDALKTWDGNIVVAWQSFISQSPALESLVSIIALYGVYAIPVTWLIWWFISGRKQREVLLSAVTAGVLGWQVINRILKTVYFHPRPTQDLPIREIIFERPENSFPSDHTSFLVGIAMFFFFRGDKRTGWILLILAIAVSKARIAVAVHYPSDILVGIVVGIVAAWIIHRLHPWLAKTVWPWVLSIASKIRLA